jgi:hypothetical protein
MSAHAERGAPEPGTYNHVLCRFDWNPQVRFEEANYGEVRSTRCVPWPQGLPVPPRQPDRDRWRPDPDGEGGEEVCMIFVVDAHLRTRLVKLGWFDITEEWKAHLEDQVEKPVPPVGAAAELGAPVGEVIPPGRAAPTGRHAREAGAGAGTGG